MKCYEYVIYHKFKTPQQSLSSSKQMWIVMLIVYIVGPIGPRNLNGSHLKHLYGFLMFYCEHASIHGVSNNMSAMGISKTSRDTNKIKWGTFPIFCL